MFYHFVKSTWRYLRNNISYTLINLVGISIGIAVCLLIGVYIQHELSYDKYHRNYNNIYRLAEKQINASYANDGIAKLPGGWGVSVAENIPEVQKMCRFSFFGDAFFEKGKEKIAESQGLYADSTAFEIFSWQLLKGEKATALVNPNSMVVTRSFAEKYFGAKDPVGQVLVVNNTTPYKITGEIDDVPANSHFRFDFLVSMSSYKRSGVDINTDWMLWTQFYTYLLLKPGTSPTSVIQKTQKLSSEHLHDTIARNITPLLQPLGSIHLHSDLFREMEANSDVKYIYIFGCLGLFIIIIACLNFINLSMVHTAKRMNEVGIRKINGASARSLIFQYFGESFALITIASLLAVGLASIALPYVNRLLVAQLSFDWRHNSELISGFVALIVTVSLLTGIYPAIKLASFKPLLAVKGDATPGRLFTFRKAMIVVQFFVATVVIISAVVTNKQLQFLQNKKLGFNKEQVLIIPFNDPATAAHIEAVKQQLKEIAGVEDVSASGNTVGGTDYGIPATLVGIPHQQQPEMRCLVVDEDFLNTYKIDLAAGRGFSRGMASDSLAYVINEEAANQLALKDPVGQLMTMPAIHRPPGPIIGVVKNFNFRSLHEKVAPLFFFVQKSWFRQVSVRIKETDIAATLERIKTKWLSIEPAYPFTYSFLSETFRNMYLVETKASALVRAFSLLAIFLACLGLLGLFSYTAFQRTREIGIRKVLGASVTGIIRLLSKEFISLIFIASLLAFPISWWATNKWLQDFAYRTNIDWWVFAIGGLIAVVVAGITISFQAIKAAMANPVKSLRTE
jgi:putative ABC transport system permease protein